LLVICPVGDLAVLMRIFRSCKTLICPTNSILQEAGYRILLNPISLCFLLDRLEYCNSQTSRIENRVRLGSTVLLRNESTREYLTLRIVKDEKAYPSKGIVSFTSIIGFALLGLRCGDIAHIKTYRGVFDWQLFTVSHNE
jgi:transcription elongation factor GreA